MLVAFNASLSAFNALSAVVAAFHVYQIRGGIKKSTVGAVEEEITNGLSASEMNYKSCVYDSRAMNGRTDGGIERGSRS